ncbi:hypothetical protein DFJ73DRAFT_163080 [Zopfochytrium polystomum]|nr:hypothetical protein DFJ73DRAFT_163080 [Zopfochytrium polystomum]
MQLLSLAQELLADGLAKSALLVTGIALSSPSRGGKDEARPANDSEAYTLFGDCLVELGETRRAMSYYGRAMSSSSVQLGRPSQRSSQRGSSKEDSVTKFCKSALAAKEYNAAKSVLESIPEQSRTVAQNRLLATVYEATGQKSLALSCFKCILKIQPLAVEAMLPLLKEYSIEELTKLCDNKAKSWLYLYLKASKSLAHNLYKQAASDFEHLEAEYRNNVHLLTMTGTSYIKAGCPCQGSQYLSQVRKIDPESLDGMDQYAGYLSSQQQLFPLNGLVNSMMEVSTSRPESLVAMAHHCCAKRDYENALRLLDQAVLLDPRFAPAYTLKGTIFLNTKRPGEAIPDFQRSLQLCDDIASFKGLMESYLAVQRLKEALATAQDAVKKVPSNPHALVLGGIVLSHFSDCKDKAKSAFEKALLIDPECLEALFGLCSILHNDRKWSESAKLLESHTSHHNSAVYWTRLADVYTMQEDHASALEKYNQALALNPNYEPALRGFARVEKLVAGE